MILSPTISISTYNALLHVTLQPRNLQHKLKVMPTKSQGQPGALPLRGATGPPGGRSTHWVCFIHCSQEQFHFLLFGFGKNFQTALFKLSEQCWSLPDGAFADRRHGTSDIFLRFFMFLWLLMLVLGLNVLDFRWKCLNTGNSDICFLFGGGEEERVRFSYHLILLKNPLLKLS